MKESLVISGRGQVTLPAAMRKRLGIRPGGVIVAEDRDGAIVLRPAAVVELHTYSDEEISGWDRDDALDSKERETILEAVKRRR